jgi:hypothetical protein
MLETRRDQCFAQEARVAPVLRQELLDSHVAAELTVVAVGGAHREQLTTSRASAPAWRMAPVYDLVDGDTLASGAHPM